jgi:hypothetical protein
VVVQLQRSGRVSRLHGVLVSVEFVERKVEENRSAAAAVRWERKEVARVQRGLPSWWGKKQSTHAVLIPLYGGRG